MATHTQLSGIRRMHTACKPTTCARSELGRTQQPPFVHTGASTTTRLLHALAPARAHLH